MSRRRDLETINSDEFITIGELARISGIRYSTLKFYSEEGLLQFIQNDIGLTRRYRREDALSQLEAICNLRKKGMSIGEIKLALQHEPEKKGENRC